MAQFVHWAGQVPVTKALVAAWKEALLGKKGTPLPQSTGKLTALDRFLTILGLGGLPGKARNMPAEIVPGGSAELTREEYFRLVNAASGKPRLMLLLEQFAPRGSG